MSEGEPMIPAARALIGWSYVPGANRVGKVVVLECPPDGFPDAYGPREWQEAECTHGACNRMWLWPCRPYQTPAGVFGDMLVNNGFASPEHLMEALRQFAKIKSCGWARTMLAVAGQP